MHIVPFGYPLEPCGQFRVNFRQGSRATVGHNARQTFRLGLGRVRPEVRTTPDLEVFLDFFFFFNRLGCLLNKICSCFFFSLHSIRIVFFRPPLSRGQYWSRRSPFFSRFFFLYRPHTVVVAIRENRPYLPANYTIPGLIVGDSPLLPLLIHLAPESLPKHPSGYLFENARVLQKRTPQIHG